MTHEHGHDNHENHASWRKVLGTLGGAAIGVGFTLMAVAQPETHTVVEDGVVAYHTQENSLDDIGLQFVIDGTIAVAVAGVASLHKALFGEEHH